MITRALAAGCVIVAALLAFAGGSAAQVNTSAPAGVTWSDNAKGFRGQNGAHFTYICPAGGSFSSTWGTDVYTDDSSVCTAAVHAGRITQIAGGIVTIEIQVGLSSYTGTARNGVTTSSYGAWSGSFTLTGASAGGGLAGVRMGQAGWSATATSYRGQNGMRYRYTCPAGGQPGNIWGTTVYTDDTSVCTAAVHSGRITFVRGGTVTIQIRPGRPSYASSTRHAVTSRSYGPWSGSYVFVGG